MRILIGILHCIENEFEDCLTALKAQTYQDWDYFVLRNMPNKEAHDSLYAEFMNKACDFDLFLKVDADMVITRNTFLQELIDQMNVNELFNHFRIGVFDHFTKRIIHAMHVYRSDVKWYKNEELYFVDMVNNQVRTKTFIKASDPLVPAANHCPNPSSFQSFHFGLHKVSKIIQTGASVKNEVMARVHLETVKRVFELHENNMCLLGIVWAFSNKVSSKEVDYNSNSVLEAHQYYHNKPTHELEIIIGDWIKSNPFDIRSDVWDEFAVRFYTLGQPFWIAQIKSWLWKIKRLKLFTYN
ncbi:hypothetical protein [Marinoscillum sp.]|uniref:hypothetical protein n=1 Tax=Marinoscillum sp. TaxID=2024838 RepID=UPI003BABA3EB